MMFYTKLVSKLSYQRMVLPVKSKFVTDGYSINHILYAPFRAIATDIRCKVGNPELSVELNIDPAHPFIAHQYVYTVIPRFAVQVIAEFTIGNITFEYNLAVRLDHDIADKHLALISFPLTSGSIANIRTGTDDQVATSQPWSVKQIHGNFYIGGSGPEFAVRPC